MIKESAYQNITQLDDEKMEKNESILGDINIDAVEPPYLQRLMVTFVDIVVEVGLMVAFYFLFPRDLLVKLLDISSSIKFVITLFIIFFYRFSCILLLRLVWQYAA